MIECRFLLNDQPMSEFCLGSHRFPAFSGLDGEVNRRAAMCRRNTGPIPVGKYYIFDRESGGFLGPLRDMFRDKSDWFSLYAIDKKIDDYVLCNHIMRGNFRLHPKGGLGRSEGCIVIERESHFKFLSERLKASPQVAVAGTSLKAYGLVRVE